MDSTLDSSVLLSNSLNDSLEGDNSLSDGWSLLLWESWEGSSESSDLSVDSSDSLDNLSFSDNELVNNWLDNGVEWSGRSRWSSWSERSLGLESDDSDGLLNMNNLLVDSVDDLLEFSNSLSEQWSLISWNAWEFLGQSSDSLSDVNDSLDKLGDSSSKGLDDFLLDSSDWSWLVSGFSCGWKSWSSDRSDSLSQDVNLVGDSLDSLSQNNKLSGDNRSSWSWGSLQFSDELVDGVSDDSNLLNKLSSSLGDFVNNSFFNMNQRSLWSSGRWSLNISDNVSNSLNLSSDSGDGFLQDIDLVDESWSSLLWLLRKSGSELPDSLSDNGNLVLENNNLLGQGLNDSLLNSGEVSWLLLTLSDNVFLLLIPGNQSLGQLGFFFGKDSTLFGILGLVGNDIILLKGHSGLGLGD